MKKMSNEEIREKVLDSYHRVYDTYGVQPNRLLVSRNVFNQLTKTEHVIATDGEEDTLVASLLGLKAIIVEGRDRIEVAFVYER